MYSLKLYWAKIIIEIYYRKCSISGLINVFDWYFKKKSNKERETSHKINMYQRKKAKKEGCLCFPVKTRNPVPTLVGFLTTCRMVWLTCPLTRVEY